jgi:methionyl-tRNA formyltransferase
LTDHGAATAPHQPDARGRALRIVVFASGSPFSMAAIARLRRDHQVLGIVTPPAPSGLRQLLRRMVRRAMTPLMGLGGEQVPIHKADALITRTRPDLLVVASFPQRIPGAMLARAPLGALNLHMSLLPRHRGVDPVFWTYWDNDAAGGVSVHWMDERLDAGDIALQAPLALNRGRASRDFYAQLADLGVDLLSQVLQQVAAGQRPCLTQPEAGASYRNAADIAAARIPLAAWPAERVWHVLAGLGDQFHGLIKDAGGNTIAHRRATRFRLAPGVEAGRIVRTHEGLELHCSDGIVFAEVGP